MSSKEFERGEPNRRSIRLKPNKLEVVTMGELPPLSSPQPTRVIVRNLRNEQQHRPPQQVDIRDGYSLKLSDITGSTSSTVVQDTTEDNQSLSVLQTLERQINTMEFDTRMKQERSTEPIAAAEPKKERPVHYGELPSLLNTGISDVAGNGFGYMDKPGSDSDENLTPASFKRGEDSRSSTGGAIGSTYARKLKTTRTVNRTVSDSKNAENTAKLLRQKKPPAPRPPMIIPTTSPPQVTKLVPKDRTLPATVPSTNSSASSMASSTGSASIAAAAKPPPIPTTSSTVKNATERKISSEILKHVVGPQKAQVLRRQQQESITPRAISDPAV